MGITNVFNQILSPVTANKFETEYSLLDKYIVDDVKRSNMLSNNELKKIYNSNKTAIKFFLIELDRHFDIETIRQIVDSTILRMPENILVSFMTAYLNSSEIAKSNTEILSFYNKIQNLGEEAVKYVEENGIITSRKYTELPIQIIEEKYEQIKCGTESFNGEMLDDHFKSLNPVEKVFVYKLVESNSFELLEQLFNGKNYSLRSILKLLTSHKIDDQIINMDVSNSIGLNNLYVLILLILDTEYYEMVVNNVNSLIIGKRYNLLMKLINEGLIRDLYRVNINQVNELNDREIYEILTYGQRIYRLDTYAA